jgi:hypothetical protein
VVRPTPSGDCRVRCLTGRQQVNENWTWRIGLAALQRHFKPLVDSASAAPKD